MPPNGTSTIRYHQPVPGRCRTRTLSAGRRDWPDGDPRAAVRGPRDRRMQRLAAVMLDVDELWVDSAGYR
jgi:hypothetical protein